MAAADAAIYTADIFIGATEERLAPSACAKTAFWGLCATTRRLLAACRAKCARRYATTSGAGTRREPRYHGSMLSYISERAISPGRQRRARARHVYGSRWPKWRYARSLRRHTMILQLPIIIAAIDAISAFQRGALRAICRAADGSRRSASAFKVTESVRRYATILLAPTPRLRP